MKVVYKIREKESGLYSNGGMHPNWSKKGKIWNTRGAVSNHLRIASSHYYKNAEIVEFFISETEDVSYPVSDWSLADSTIRAKKFEEQRRKEEEKDHLSRKIQQLEHELKSLKVEMK